MQLTDPSRSARIKPTEVPPTFWLRTYHEEGIEETREDRYGETLTFVYAGTLAKIKLAADAWPWNRGVIAMVRALDPKTPIILMWT